MNYQKLDHSQRKIRRQRMRFARLVCHLQITNPHLTSYELQALAREQSKARSWDKNRRQ